MKTQLLLTIVLLCFGLSHGHGQCDFADFDLQTEILHFDTELKSLDVASGTMNAYEFLAETGKVYAFSACLSDFDSYLVLYDDEMQIVSENDDDGMYCSGTSASLAWQCVKSGTYYIGFSSYQCEPTTSSAVLQYGYPTEIAIDYTYENVFSNECGPGTKQLSVYEVVVETSGIGSPLSVDNFVFEFSSTSAISDFKTAELYFIGSDDVFDKTSFDNGDYTLIAKHTIKPDVDLLFSKKTDLFSGSNKYVLLVDVAESAMKGNSLSVALKSYEIEDEVQTVSSDIATVSILPYTEVKVGIDYYWGSVSVGDADADGDMDVLIAEGMLENDNNNFDNSIDLTNYCDFSVFADLNNDGLIDILTSEEGVDDSNYGFLYFNNGNLAFEKQSSLTFPFIWNDGDYVVADFNNDGLNDIIFTGYIDGKNQTFGYLNHKDSLLLMENIDMEGFDYSAMDAGDVNNDGYIDLIICGENENYDFETKLYINNGSTFTELNVDLPAVAEGDVKFGDYDQDGDLDILLSGATHYEYILPETYVFENVDGEFKEQFFDLEGVYLGAVNWVDYDGDGDLDIHLYGALDDLEPNLSYFYENTGDGFIADEPFSIASTESSYVQWADVDYDGDVDMVLNGYDDDYVIYVYINHNTTKNSAPMAPNNVSADVKSRSVNIGWGAGADEESPVSSLMYNLRVGTEPLKGNVVNPMSLSDGRLLLPTTGNVGARNSFELNNLEPGEYFYAVQTIDQTGNASAFSEEKRFFIGMPPELCLVTSTPEGHNIVSWERYTDRGIKEYVVYRESEKADVFEEIGRVPFNEVSVFVDSASNVLEQSYSYAISSVDSADYEVEMGKVHTTIHLKTALSFETPAKVNLWWNEYKGFPVESYIIYKGNTKDGMEELVTLSANVTSYSDLMPTKDTYYQIAVEAPQECVPLELKTNTGPYSQSLSNIAEVKVEVVNTSVVDMPEFSVYPLPAHDVLTINFDDGLAEAKYTLMSASGYSIVEGEVINGLAKIDVSSLSFGLYMLMVEYEGEGYSVPVIVK